MAIRLNFTNPNNPDSVKIYRSEAKIDLSALPEPLAVLPGDATSYSDVTAVRNKVYYYIVGSFKGTDALFTPNQQYGYFPDTGPGPTKLLRGTWNEGYFGTCTTAELFTSQELITALNVGGSITPAGGTNVWHKFVLDSKILFIPDITIGSVTWLELYKQGLVYGTDDTGATPAALSITPVNQKRTVVKGGRTYLVRLPKASGAPTTEILTDTTVADARWGEGEWNRTAGRLGAGSFTYCTRSRLGNKMGNTLSNTSGTMAFTQHMRSLSQIFLVAYGTSLDTPTPMSYSGAYYAWRPVLELQL